MLKHESYDLRALVVVIDVVVVDLETVSGGVINKKKIRLYHDANSSDK